MLRKIILALLTLGSSVWGESKAIIFDFGGVMTGEPHRALVVDFLCRTLHLSKQEFEVINKEKKAACKAGKTDVEFWLE